MYSDRRGPTAFSSFLSSRLGPNAPADNGPPAGGNWSRGGGGGRGRGRGRGRRGGAQGGGPPEQGEIVFGGDKDGDIGMGGEDDAGKKRFTPYGAPRKGKQKVQFVDGPNIAALSQPASGNDSVVEITNWERGTEDELKALVLQRAKVNLRNMTYSGPLLLARLPTREALAVKRACDGSKFKGQKLRVILQKTGEKLDAVKKADEEAKKKVATIVDAIRHFIRSRWNPDILMCDISRFGEDAAVRKAGVRSLEDGRKTGEVVCKLLGEECPNLMSLRAEYLNLHSLHPLSTILSHCPKLANLSLANNKLPNFDALLPLRNTPLNELILTGNPVRENEVRKNGSESAKWRAGVRKIFPTLKILDDMPVEDGEEEMEDDQQASQRGPKGVQLPLPIQKGFADMDETRLLVADFVSKFFPLFDANRNALLALYHPNAVFSLSASTAAPPGHRPQNRRVDDMTGWFGRNRSHERVKGAKRDALLAKSPQQIVAAFSQLPATRHPQHDSNRLIFDAWMPSIPVGDTTEQVVFLTVHGEFIEVKLNGLKAFSRTFIIAPAAPDSVAALAGWGYTILNDELQVRIWRRNMGWREALEPPAAVVPAAVAPAVPVPGQPVAPVAPAPGAIEVPGQTLEQALQLKAQHGLSDQQHLVILQIQLRTRLTYGFALQLVNESAGDPDKALALFEAARANVPAEAFLPG